MTDDRKQAKALDLPDYPHPPFIGDLATHAGTWTWVSPWHIAQDDDGYLWIKGTETPASAPSTRIYAVAAWSEEGISVFVSKRAYGHLARISGPVDTSAWIPVAKVMTEHPGYATRPEEA